MMNYRNFEIEIFEFGRGLWHARCRRADHKPTLIDDVELEFLDVGIAWPSVEAAITDAQNYIDRMKGHLNTVRASCSHNPLDQDQFRK
jgi:hypothetical protein